MLGCNSALVLTVDLTATPWITFDAEVAETVSLGGKGPQECCVGLGAIGCANEMLHVQVEIKTVAVLSDLCEHPLLSIKILN